MSLDMSGPSHIHKGYSPILGSGQSQITPAYLDGIQKLQQESLQSPNAKQVECSGFNITFICGHREYSLLSPCPEPPCRHHHAFPTASLDEKCKGSISTVVGSIFCSGFNVHYKCSHQEQHWLYPCFQGVCNHLNAFLTRVQQKIVLYVRARDINREIWTLRTKVNF